MRVSMPLVAAATLLAILIAIYGPGIGKGFVKDDVVWVGANHVTSWSDVRALLFRTDGFYRPVVAATFALDRAVYGLAPFGFGVTNLILLLLGACALAYLATSLGLRATTAVVVAGVWVAQLSRGEHGGAVVERAHRAVCCDRRVPRRRCPRPRQADCCWCRGAHRDAREGRSGDVAVHPEWMGMGARRGTDHNRVHEKSFA